MRNESWLISYKLDKVIQRQKCARQNAPRNISRSWTFKSTLQEKIPVCSIRQLIWFSLFHFFCLFSFSACVQTTMLYRTVGWCEQHDSSYKVEVLLRVVFSRLLPFWWEFRGKRHPTSQASVSIPPKCLIRVSIVSRSYIIPSSVYRHHDHIVEAVSPIVPGVVS